MRTVVWRRLGWLGSQDGTYTGTRTTPSRDVTEEKIGSGRAGLDSGCGLMPRPSTTPSTKGRVAMSNHATSLAMVTLRSSCGLTDPAMAMLLGPTVTPDQRAA